MGRAVKGKTGGWELAVPLASDGYSVQNGVPCDVSLETLEHGLIWGNKVFMVKSLKMRSNGLPKSNSRCPERGTTVRDMDRKETLRLA